MDRKHSPFDHPDAIASYEVNAVRNVPGLADLHRMVMLLLAERAGTDAHILVVGAGGGMETKAMAEAQPDWHFTGVDPSSAMLDLARRKLAPFAKRVDLIEGAIDQAPDGPFDGATCLLTLHHLDRTSRLQTLRGIRHRLRPGANLVVAEHTAPGPDPGRWMGLSVAFSGREGPDPAKSAATAKLMTERLPLLSPVREEELLCEAGFTNVELYYAAFSFRGWVGTAC